MRKWRQGLARFVWRRPGWDEIYPVQAAPSDCCVGQRQMAVMDGVEPAPEEANVHRFRLVSRFADRDASGIGELQELWPVAGAGMSDEKIAAELASYTGTTAIEIWPSEELRQVVDALGNRSVRHRLVDPHQAEVGKNRY